MLMVYRGGPILVELRILGSSKASSSQDRFCGNLESSTLLAHRISMAHRIFNDRK
jgi:hypothetical protein